MKSVVMCALMISVALGSMAGGVDHRIKREDGTPSTASVNDDGTISGIESLDGKRFQIWDVLGTFLLITKNTAPNGIVAMTESGQKLFAAKTESRAPIQENNLVGAFEVKEIQAKSQLWIAPNGTKWRQTIDNSGNITKVQVQ